MPADNNYIANQFSMLAKLMEIHGDNSFKAKSFAIAAFNIEKLPVQLPDLAPEKIFTLKGIGDSLGKKIIEIIDKGHLQALEEYILKTPQGVLEMLSIKGLGPKKIGVIWKEMEIESLGELLYACTENRLARYKGFGEKTQAGIRESISFYQKSQGSHLFAEVESYALDIHKMLAKDFPSDRFVLTGAFRRQSEIIDRLEWVTTVPVKTLQNYFRKKKFDEEEVLTGTTVFKSPEKLTLQFFSRSEEVFYQTLFETSCSQEFLEEWNNKKQPQVSSSFDSEEEIFSARKIDFIPPYLREKPGIIDKANAKNFAKIIQPGDIKAIIHCHSDWSDGSNTIEKMAKACMDRGYEYIVLSDHSKSAFYANGLSEERVKEQHRYIDELNAKLSPFRIFKSIECDILNDGSLDYTKDILSTFDLVITSVHSNIKMTEEKAMMRLLNAINNPYTTILGHMTARMLLSRPGFPVDHRKIIDACAAKQVAIEINANPRRLDMEWKWVDYAIDKGVTLAIDPDAHDISEFDNCKYGVLVAQKGGLTPTDNLSSFSLKEFEAYLKKIKTFRKI